MKLCIECGKKIGILNSYNHPVKGKKYTVCGDCFTSIDKLLTLWREFVLSNSVNNEITEISLNDINTSFANINNDLRKIFTNFKTMKEKPENLYG